MDISVGPNLTKQRRVNGKSKGMLVRGGSGGGGGGSDDGSGGGGGGGLTEIVCVM